MRDFSRQGQEATAPTKFTKPRACPLADLGRDVSDLDKKGQNPESSIFTGHHLWMSPKEENMYIINSAAFFFSADPILSPPSHPCRVVSLPESRRGKWNYRKMRTDILFCNVARFEIAH